MTDVVVGRGAFGLGLPAGPGGKAEFTATSSRRRRPAPGGRPPPGAARTRREEAEGTALKLKLLAGTVTGRALGTVRGEASEALQPAAAGVLVNTCRERWAGTGCAIPK